MAVMAKSVHTPLRSILKFTFIFVPMTMTVTVTMSMARAAAAWWLIMCGSMTDHDATAEDANSEGQRA